MFRAQERSFSGAREYGHKAGCGVEMQNVPYHGGPWFYLESLRKKLRVGASKMMLPTVIQTSIL